ncbi:phenylacetate-CoA oxygenase subunit PaaC [soil metagenome]
MTTSEALSIYCIRIADNAVILAHRLSEWSGHAPILEEDIAMSNMALDFIGQAQGFYTYAGKLEGKGRTEDDFAYHRDTREYTNCFLVEQPNGDFASTMLRSFFYCSFAYLQFKALTKSKDETISGLAEKSLKEIIYHVRHSSDWMIRLGDGTDESHRRAQNAVDDLWSYTHELFDMNEVDTLLMQEGVAFELAALRSEWDLMVEEVFAKATLKKPAPGGYQSKGGIIGLHSEHLGYILAEMQALPRMYPDAKW